MEETSRKYLTINTPKGLYEVLWLLYDVKMAPHLFQLIMDQMLQGIPGVCCYINDILITTPNEAQSLVRLEAVLERLKKFNICAKREKCTFLAPKVRYPGHMLSKEGCTPLPEKVQSIIIAKEPKDVSELRMFLGYVNY